MLYAYAEATVPKITVVLRKGYGGAKQALCTREMGADQLWSGRESSWLYGRRRSGQCALPARDRTIA